MVLLAAVVAAGVVLAVAALIVRREAFRLSADPFAPIFSADEAYERVVDELPDLVAATLDADDVRRILEFEMDFFDQHGIERRPDQAPAVPGLPGAPAESSVLVVDEVAIVDYVMERSAGMGVEYLPEQVHAVVEIQLRYLRVIGAVGPAVDSDP